MQTKYNYEQYMNLLKTPNNEAMMQSIVKLYLNCRKLTTLPKLPPNLQELYCDYNQLSKLPDSLPPSLQELDCSHNQLHKLPDSLPPNLQRLDCNNNQLSNLPGTLPPTLQYLHCRNNLLQKLPDSLPPSLQRLDCSQNQIPTLLNIYYSYNQLSKLPDSLPPTLQELDCRHNQLTQLPDSLPPNLQKLDCSHNQLRSLPDSLPPNLQTLDCRHNQLIQLPDSLPPTLKYLYCENNQLLSLPDLLPPTLQRLYCENNQLTTLPLSIIHTQCYYHSYLQYSNNPIEYLPVQIVRWLNHVKTSQCVYQDTQSVHNHSIQLGIMDSVTWLTRSKPSIDLNQVIEAIVCEANSSFQFQTKSKQLLLEYCNDQEVHGTFHLTFAELLTAVWSHILTYSSDVRNEIWKVLDTEMQDAECKCFTGRMSRLVNCLNGFDDRIKIHISDNEQIGNIVSIERTRIESLDYEMTDSEIITLLKTNVERALKERAYSDTVIQEWIEYIE